MTEETEVLEAGLDVFFLPEGETRIPACPVCGGALEVTRDVVGPTSFGAAMAARHGGPEARARALVAHDVARCPAATESWHVAAARLVKEARRTASPSVRSLIEADIAALIASRGGGGARTGIDS